MFSGEYVAEPLHIKDGTVRLPTTPGHAPWIDWERVHALRPE